MHAQNYYQKNLLHKFNENFLLTIRGATRQADVTNILIQRGFLTLSGA